jgi:hypothetical protein
MPIIVPCHLLAKSLRTNKMLAWMKGVIPMKMEIHPLEKELKVTMKQSLLSKTFTPTLT